jgi:hypothetical protein
MSGLTGESSVPFVPHLSRGRRGHVTCEVRFASASALDVCRRSGAVWS